MADEPTNDSTPNPTPDPTPDPSPEPNTSTILTPDPDPAPEPDPTPDPDPDPAPEPTDEEKAAAEAEAARAALFGAPEGDYELALPDDVTVDAAALAAVTPVAKKLGLSNEGLSEIAGVYAAEVLPQVTQQVIAGIELDVANTHKQWATDTQDMVQTDPIFEGTRDLKQVQAVAAKTLDRLADPAFRDFLRETGIGNHPAMVKFAYQVGNAISEDTTFERGGTPPREKTRAEKFYGTKT